jgi:hypothetical protein
VFASAKVPAMRIHIAPHLLYLKNFLSGVSGTISQKHKFYIYLRFLLTIFAKTWFLCPWVYWFWLGRLYHNSFPFLLDLFLLLGIKKLLIAIDIPPSFFIRSTHMALDKVTQFSNGARLATSKVYPVSLNTGNKMEYFSLDPKNDFYVESTEAGWFGARKTKIYKPDGTYDIWESGWFGAGGKKTSAAKPWTPQNDGESIFS